LHTMVIRRARIQDVLKVKVKGHVIRTLLITRKSLLLPCKQDLIATKLTHHGPRTGLHPGSAQGQGQGQRSRDTDTCDFTKIASSRRQMAGTLPNLHMMVRSQPVVHPGYAQGRGQRSRDTGTYVMSRNVCYTVRSHVLSLHVLTLWNTIILSFSGGARILEQAGPAAVPKVLW